MTIAVRDKVIEKFADQPLDEMNESVKALLSKEEDEQKRLGILAARVYILRQRILSIAEADPDRVISGTSPKPKDLGSAESVDTGETETAASEWTRLRILEDCEVNGVRFPKTVIIDVKSADAERLVENGKAELIEESEPAPIAPEAAAEAAPEAAPEAEIDAPGKMPSRQPPRRRPKTSSSLMISRKRQRQSRQMMQKCQPQKLTIRVPCWRRFPMSRRLTATRYPTMPQMNRPSLTQEESASGEAVIEAPSAAEVTAALEALGAGGSDDTGDTDGDESAEDAADVAAELAALSAASDSPEGAEETSEDAAEVAAALEAASAAMAAGPSNTDISDLPAAGAEQDEDEDGSDKPAGWFEAQQNAEKPHAARILQKTEIMRIMTRADRPAGRGLAVALMATPVLLGGCWDLTRFEQERYECSFNQSGLVEIDMRAFDVGDEVTVAFSDETLEMQIIESSDSNFSLASGPLVIRIDRKSGTVRLTRGSRYRNIKCSKSEFTM